MMTLFLFLHLISNPQLEKARQLYWLCENNIAKGIFYSFTQEMESDNAVSLAYSGVATAMQADLVGSIKDKLKYFNRGKEMLEDAIQKDPLNAEIRFLRFSVQSKIPGFLGYDHAMDEDAQLILAQLQLKNHLPSSEFWKRALVFMKESEEIDRNVLEKLNSINI